MDSKDNKDSKEVVILKKALERQKKARQQAEHILEEKSKELYDVTHHLQETNSKLENLLNEKTSELDGVFINIIDPYVVMDLNFNVINMNSSAKEFLGYDHSKENLNLAKIVHENFVEYTIQSFKSLIEVGTLKNYRAKIIAKDKSEKWVQINSSLVYNADRKPIAAQGIVRDITQETEIKELLIEEKRQKEKLLKDLEKSNEGLQEYAHIVSHDLKSPLRSISALSSWLVEDYHDKLDDNGKFNLQQIQEKIEGMDRLIDGILKYSSITDDTLENSLVDLNAVINEIREIIFVPDHVNIVIMNSLPKIRVDQTKIQQLFQNLISNAVVNIECEVGLVEISSKETETHWQFSVKDNGVGIPEEYHKKIFKVFQSIGNNERSTGIGLSIVKKIIDLYQGKIWLDSTVGKGTSFHFTLKNKMQEYPNLSYIKELSGEDTDFEQKFIAILKEEFPEETKKYYGHIAKNELQMAAEIVHKLKHKFNILSLSNAYQLAVVYEEELRVGNADKDKSLRPILNQIKDYLNTYK